MINNKYYILRTVVSVLFSRRDGVYYTGPAVAAAEGHNFAAATRKSKETRGRIRSSGGRVVERDRETKRYEE